MMAQIKNLPSPLSAKIVRAENIKDRSFREVYQYFQANGFLELPVTINRDFKRKDRQSSDLIRSEKTMNFSLST